MCFAVHLIAARSSPRQHSTINVNDQQGLCDERRNVFLWRPGCRTPPGRKEVESVFGLWDLKGDDSWQMHHYWWPLVLSETDLDWIGGWCSSASCHVSLLHREQLSDAQRLFGLNQTKKTTTCIRIFAFPDLFISLLLFYVGTKLSSWVGHRAYRFPWNCLICPPLQKGEAVQSFHCLLLPQPGSHMTWHDPKLIWIPVTPMPAFFIGSLCFMPPFSSSVELPPSGGALSAFLACWGVKKKGKTKPLSWSQLVDVFHLQFVSLSHSVFIHSLPIWLGPRRAEEKPSTNIFLFHSKSTRTRDTLPSWQPWDCGRRGLCDGGRPAGHALNTPTVLQRRGAGKGEA